MPTELLSAGPAHTMLQNVIYALPASRIFLKSSAAVEVAAYVGGSFSALTGSNTTGVETAACFVRCTTGNCEIVVKKA